MASAIATRISLVKTARSPAALIRVVETENVFLENAFVGRTIKEKTVLSLFVIAIIVESA